VDGGGLKAKGEGRGLMGKAGFKELRVWQKGEEPCGLHLSNNKKKHLRR